MTINQTFCPASMCPLFAPNGSPWTGNYNSVCPQKAAYVEGKDVDYTGCGFYHSDEKGCDGVGCANLQLREVRAMGSTLQIGPVQQKLESVNKNENYDCGRAHECQWQIQIGALLCPPRQALKEGIDPRSVAF